MKRIVIIALMAFAFFVANNVAAKGHRHIKRCAKFVHYKNGKKKFLKKCCLRLRQRTCRKKLLCK